MNIALIGFMGTGKSTVAKCMNSIFSMEILEMDQLIEEREKRKISEIFSEKGEDYFRSLETNLLEEVQQKDHVIVSCGGGVVMRAENVEILKKKGVIVLLTALPETILSRIKENEDRPLLKGKKDVESISRLMEARREKYEAAADIIVSTDGKDATQICEEIKEKIRKMEMCDV